MDTLLSKIISAPIDQLVPYPGNPRRGDVAAIRDSLELNKQYSPLVVQASTKHVLVGNHTLRAARDLGWKTISVVFVEVDDAQAKRIMLSSNRTADLATYDADAITAQLEELQGRYEGTGWDSESAAKYLKDTTGDAPNTGDSPESWNILIICRDEDQQNDLLDKFLQEGLDAKALLT